MAVIVSSRIGQPGSQAPMARNAIDAVSGGRQNAAPLSGDIEHIVVIKTDPGYAGDPGHASTGAIVATIC